MRDDIFDASGNPIFTDTGWATKTHISNDPFDPWFSIKLNDGSDTQFGVGRFKSNSEMFDPLLPDWMKQ